MNPLIPPDDLFAGGPADIDPKQFYRLLETSFAAIPTGTSVEESLRFFVPAFLDRLGTALSIETIHLYRREPDGFARIAEWGTPPMDISKRIDWLTSERAEGSELPWVGRTPEGVIGVAAIEPDHRLALAIRFAVHVGDHNSTGTIARLKISISTLHHTLNQELSLRALRDVIEQARIIQVSLLPEHPPRFANYDIAAISVPAVTVGGDLYDFIPVDPETLALVIADASGHGLPAAIQARDVITGLRMGVERDLKITRVVERLGTVIHDSGLSSRFVSLVFGELESNGNFSYVNAGHPPPLLLDAAGFSELSIGGMILGPREDSPFKLGFAHMDRGSTMALYTDGVMERMDGSGREFGMEGIRAWMMDWAMGPAEAAVQDLIRRLRAHAGDAPFEDDVTVVFVRRPG